MNALIDPNSLPPPIEPEGILDRLNWRAIILAGLLDNILTVVLGLVLIYRLAPEAVSPDDAGADRAMNEALLSPEFLFWGAVLGLAVTVYAAYWGARRAGTRHLRHGGWIAIVAAAMGTLLYLIPGADESARPVWYDALGYVLMFPAGLLGGFLASKTQRASP